MTQKKSTNVEPVKEPKVVVDVEPETVIVEDDTVEQRAVLHEIKPQHVIRASEGDSYLSIAERYIDDPRTAREFAKILCDLNGCAPLTRGTKVTVPQR